VNPASPHVTNTNIHYISIGLRYIRVSIDCHYSYVTNLGTELSRIKMLHIYPPPYVILYQLLQLPVLLSGLWGQSRSRKEF
jgi:hypothetical protein